MLAASLCVYQCLMLSVECTRVCRLNRSTTVIQFAEALDKRESSPSDSAALVAEMHRGNASTQLRKDRIDVLCLAGCCEHIHTRDIAPLCTPGCPE